MIFAITVEQLSLDCKPTYYLLYDLWGMSNSLSQEWRLFFYRTERSIKGNF
jgi:hypothetical protein